MNAIFYTPNVNLAEQQYVLPPEEAKHVVKVLRMQQGDTLLLTDGGGHFIYSRIEHIEGKKCWVAFDKIEKQNPFPYRLNLAVAPTKNTNRYEWLLEKVTEIGVASIIPLISFHSERRKLNTERLEKILISAMKQSQKAYLPELSEATSFQDIIGRPMKGKKYIAHCHPNFERKAISATYKKGEDVTILIGPEGDFSKEEIQQAIAAGFDSIHLGTSRLRTETAGIVACSSIYQLNY